MTLKPIYYYYTHYIQKRLKTTCGNTSKLNEKQTENETISGTRNSKVISTISAFNPTIKYLSISFTSKLLNILYFVIFVPFLVILISFLLSLFFYLCPFLLSFCSSFPPLFYLYTHFFLLPFNLISLPLVYCFFLSFI